MMKRKIKAVVDIGITESFRAPLRDHGIGGLLVNWVLNLIPVLVPFFLLYFRVIKGYGIGWYIHFAVFFEVIALLVSGEKEITDYTSMAQFPVSAGEVLFLRTVRRFINPSSLVATAFFIASIVISYTRFFKDPLHIIGIITMIAAYLVVFEDVQLWKEKAGKGNLLTKILTVIAVAMGVLPFFLGKQYTIIYWSFNPLHSHWYMGLIALAISIGGYALIVKIPRKRLERFVHDSASVSTSNIVVKIINALPGGALKQLIMKDYRVMLHSNISLIISIAIWVVIAWFMTKYQAKMDLPAYLDHEFIALCYVGVIIQIYSNILSRPFAGDSYSAWVTLLSPVPRKYILLSKDIVVLIACVIFFIPMSIYLHFWGGGISFKQIGLWFLLFLCFAFVMAIMLNRNLVTTKMKIIKNGKRKAAVNAILDFVKRLFIYAIAILIGVGFQALLDSKYAFLSLFITVPVLIILVFSWYIGLEAQVKYINKYTQSITQALVLS